MLSSLNPKTVFGFLSTQDFPARAQKCGQLLSRGVGFYGKAFGGVGLKWLMLWVTSNLSKNPSSLLPKPTWREDENPIALPADCCLRTKLDCVLSFC